MDQRAVTAIFIGYSLERKGWLFYSPNYKPSIFWSNSAKFLETKSWLDHTPWRPVSAQLPPTLTHEEDFKDLIYLEENLFDETHHEPLSEYMDTEPLTEAKENIGEEPSRPTIASFGLKATGTRQNKNLDPTVREALSGPDRGL